MPVSEEDYFKQQELKRRLEEERRQAKSERKPYCEYCFVVHVNPPLFKNL